METFEKQFAEKLNELQGQFEQMKEKERQKRKEEEELNLEMIRKRREHEENQKKYAEEREAECEEIRQNLLSLAKERIDFYLAKFSEEEEFSDADVLLAVKRQEGRVSNFLTEVKKYKEKEKLLIPMKKLMADLFSFAETFLENNVRCEQENEDVREIERRMEELKKVIKQKKEEFTISKNIVRES